MINQEKLGSIKTLLAEGKPPTNPLLALSPAELRSLRGAIDMIVPRDSLATLNLESELVDQYVKTKGLMDDVLLDSETPANQKAQVANSVVGTLGQLVKLQEDLKRQETFKVMESVLIDVVKSLPEAAQVQFYVDYERLARHAGLME